MSKVTHRSETAECGDFVLTRNCHSSPGKPVTNALALNEEYTHGQRYTLLAKKPGLYEILFYANDGRTHDVFDVSDDKKMKVVDGLMLKYLKSGEKFSFYGKNSANWGLHIKFVGLANDY